MKIEVEEIALITPIKVIGKVFYGDYGKAYEYIQSVQAELDQHSIRWKKNKVFGLFYDNPNEKKADDLKSFQGVFVEESENQLPSEIPFMTLEVKGKFLYTKVSGSIESIYKGYEALFMHIATNNIQLKSNAGYQVSTFDGNIMLTEIYMELN
jgi:DNA gyrase inhibitor GyrI